MKSKRLIYTAIFSMVASVCVNAQSTSASDSSFPLLVIVLVLWFVVSLIILVRMWKASNDIKALKAKICNKGLAEKSIMRGEVMKLHLLDKDDEALEILNDALYDEARKLYMSTNDGKDYKGMVFYQSEDGSKKVTCDECFNLKWTKILNKYRPLYDAISHPVPQGLQTIGFSYIKQFGHAQPNEEPKDDKKREIDKAAEAGKTSKDEKRPKADKVSKTNKEPETGKEPK